MFKTGDEAVRWIHSRKKFGSRPGLIRVNELLKLCGHPEKEYYRDSHRRNKWKRFDGNLLALFIRNAEASSGYIYFAVH